MKKVVYFCLMVCLSLGNAVGQIGLPGLEQSYQEARQAASAIHLPRPAHFSAQTAVASHERVQSYKGCREATELTLMVEIYGDKEMLSQARFMRRNVCSGNGLTMYPNGKVATLDVEGIWFYPNGQFMTMSSKQKDAIWLYPNGKTAVIGARLLGSTWLYPEQTRAITYAAGRPQAPYLSKHNRLAYGPEFKTPEGDLDVVPFLRFVVDLNE